MNAFPYPYITCITTYSGQKVHHFSKCMFLSFISRKPHVFFIHPSCLPFFSFLLYFGVSTNTFAFKASYVSKPCSNPVQLLILSPHKLVHQHGPQLRVMSTILTSLKTQSEHRKFKTSYIETCVTRGLYLLHILSY